MATRGFRPLLKYFFAGVFLLSGNYCYAQNPEFAYRVYFKNKTATTFSLNAPIQFLSGRALHRRSKYNIPIDSSDLPVCQSYIDSVLAATNGIYHCKSKWLNTLVVLLSDSSLIHQAAHFTFFKKAVLVAVYPNGLQRPDSSNTRQKPTGLDQNYYGAAWKQISLCNGQYLHQQGLTGKNILIALIDAGFQNMNTLAAFDSLRQNNQIVDRWNFTHNDSLSASEGQHGTEVLSVISANLPETFVGTAPKADIALYTSEDLNSEQPIEEDNWVAAAERADSIGADIITTSLGYNTFDPPFPDEVYNHFDGKSTFAAKGANLAASKGILVVASAGNEGTTPWHYILTPGDADSALTIGAVDSTNTPFQSSSYGPNAAGVLKPDVVAMGVNSAVIGVSGNVNFSNGTSFATPVITGLAACLMQKDTTISPYLLKQIIEKSADHFSNPNDHIGYGLPNFEIALNTITGIVNPTIQQGSVLFSIYPNPIQQKSMHIHFLKPLHQDFDLVVHDRNGRVIFRKSFPELVTESLSIKFPGMASGQYLLTLQTKNCSVTQKFILP